MDNQLVTFSSTFTPEFDLQPVAAGGGPLAGISGVGNTPALLPQSQPEPMPGSSWMPDAALMPVQETMPPLTAPSAFERSLTWVQSLPGPSHRPDYSPLDAMADMVDTFSFEEAAVGTRRFAWRNAEQAALPGARRRYAGSAERIASLAETMVAASQTDTLLNDKEMLTASQWLRRLLAGNRKRVRFLVPRNCRLPLKNVASVYETLNGWGLFRINNVGVTECAVENDARQNSLIRLRKLISEQVITGIYHRQLSITSPVSEQQQQFAEIVCKVYQQEKTDALERLNSATPPGDEPEGWRRLTEYSTRAVVDETDPSDTAPQFTINVQCGEQVALTFALLLHLKPQPVPAEQLRMITFSGDDDNHSVVLYACSPACQFDALSTTRDDLRAPIATDHFLSWLFKSRRDVLILNPAALDSTLAHPAEEVKHNACLTNKCVAFYGCEFRHQIVEGFTSLLQQANIELADMRITIDHPLAEANESALEANSDETLSEHDSDVWYDSLYDTETESETGS